MRVGGRMDELMYGLMDDCLYGKIDNSENVWMNR
jgi:hypothetical protein